MLNLSVKTKINPLEALEYGTEFFIHRSGLKLEELVSHMHGQEGATEVSVIGGKIIGNREYDSKNVLKKLWIS